MLAPYDLPRLLNTAVTACVIGYLLGIGAYNLAEVWKPAWRDEQYDYWEQDQVTSKGFTVNFFGFVFRPGYRKRIVDSGILSPEAARRRAIQGGLTSLLTGILLLLAVLASNGLFQRLFQSGGAPDGF